MTITIELPKDEALQVSLAEHWRVFADNAVKAGRYASVDAVISEGLRLVEARDETFWGLKTDIDAAIAAGGRNSGADLSRSLDATFDRLRADGY